MRFIFPYLFLILNYGVNAQDYKPLTIIPTFNNEQLSLNKAYTIENESVTITNLKFYISDLQFFKNDSLVYTSHNKAHLIDVSEVSSLQLEPENLFDFTTVKFNIGIDSLTNVSGIFDGDLDPVKGMYWTWQSGYINFKLEGIAHNCPARSNKFYWHIGGYLQPFYTLRKVKLDFVSTKPKEIFIQVDKLFTKIDVSKIYHVMSPKHDAIQIADALPSIFTTDSNEQK